MFQLGHGPASVAQVAGLLMQHGVPYLDCARIAKEELAKLVLEKRAELIRSGSTDVYVISRTTPIEASEEPKPKKSRTHPIKTDER